MLKVFFLKNENKFILVNETIFENGIVVRRSYCGEGKVWGSSPAIRMNLDEATFQRRYYEVHGFSETT